MLVNNTELDSEIAVELFEAFAAAAEAKQLRETTKTRLWGLLVRAANAETKYYKYLCEIESKRVLDTLTVPEEEVEDTESMLFYRKNQTLRVAKNNFENWHGIKLEFKKTQTIIGSTVIHHPQPG